MSQYQGKGGRLVQGGILDNPSYVNGALIAGALTMNIDGNTATLKGVVLAGDQFHLAGEAGSPVHTVTGGPYVTAANAIAGITFTTVIAAGGVADNAAITWVANTVSQVRSWNLDAEEEMLDISAMGDDVKNFVGGRSEWSGSGEVILDYADLKQKALIDKIITATPVTTAFGMTFKVTVSTTSTVAEFYGAALLNRLSIMGRLGDLFLVTFNFRGSGAAGVYWV